MRSMNVVTYNICLNEDRAPALFCSSRKEYHQAECLNDPEKVADFIWSYQNHRILAEEYLYLLAMDTKGAMIGIFEVAHGSVNAGFISPREIFIRSLLCGAVGIVLVHNHPSGDPSPSREDLAVTNRIARCGDLLGIELLDHIIIGRDRQYRSLKEERLICGGRE